jgi:hypothetical protein
MTTPILLINSNGPPSHHPQESLDLLFDLLATEPLDRKFEQFGNFLYAAGSQRHGFVNPELRDAARRDKLVHVWGNFLHRSHVFSISTNDKQLLQRLSRAIRANQKRADYLSQPET